jgi:hypothetical protein
MAGTFRPLSVKPRVKADDPQKGFGPFRFAKAAQGKFARGVEAYALTCPIKIGTERFFIHNAYLRVFLQKKSPGFRACKTIVISQIKRAHRNAPFRVFGNC